MQISFGKSQATDHWDHSDFDNVSIPWLRELGKGKYSDQGNKVIPRGEAPRGHFFPRSEYFPNPNSLAHGIGIAVK